MCIATTRPPCLFLSFLFFSHRLGASVHRYFYIRPHLLVAFLLLSLLDQSPRPRPPRVSPLLPPLLLSCPFATTRQTTDPSHPKPPRTTPHLPLIKQSARPSAPAPPPAASGCAGAPPPGGAPPGSAAPAFGSRSTSGRASPAAGGCVNKWGGSGDGG